MWSVEERSEFFIVLLVGLVGLCVQPVGSLERTRFAQYPSHDGRLRRLAQRSTELTKSHKGAEGAVVSSPRRSSAQRNRDKRQRGSERRSTE